ncbi:hypothetical protein ACFVAJ_18415 [Agromyces sp. NPDC057679]|uniref:hypothetical protein n=1 Tax=Agromyces sp. NPDC057679 TaxID=3346207 RepID=UPI00366F2591
MPATTDTPYTPIDLAQVEQAHARFEATNEFGRALDALAFLPLLVAEVRQLRSARQAVLDLYHARTAETAASCTEAEDMFLADLSGILRG